MNWEDYEDVPTIDLIELIKRKDNQDDIVVAKAAFYALFYRFRNQMIKKCEILCKQKNWSYDIDVAINIADNTFKRFRKYPNFSKEKSRSDDIDEGLILYLTGIANNLFRDYYKQQNGIDISPYTGDEEIIREIREINPEDYPLEDRAEIQRNYEIMKAVLATLSEKHKIIYLTYQAYEIEDEEKKRHLPKPLQKKLREELKLKQATVRYYKNEAYNKIEEYDKIWKKTEK